MKVNLLQHMAKAFSDCRLMLRYYFATLMHKRSSTGKKIHFLCGFHGMSGGPEAIASIANLLSTGHQVSMTLDPTSPFNYWLNERIERKRETPLDADIYVCDRQADLGLVGKLRQAGKPVIATIHGMPDFLHGIDQGVANSIFELATHVHFVGLHQAQAFEGIVGKFSVIPNATPDIWQVSKGASLREYSVGMVGFFDREDKNLNGNLCAALGSKARQIHIWGPNSVACRDSRIVNHGWSQDKTGIFSSFDVFISLSRKETFGMVVAQALSCGKPCILSDIPAHRAYSLCPGVHLVDEGDTEQAEKLIDAAFDQATDNHGAIRKFWEDRFSDRVVESQWNELVRSLSEFD